MAGWPAPASRPRLMSIQARSAPRPSSLPLVGNLADVGLGGSMHSIVSQGKVEAVLASKPEERRVVFEEASGVAKYLQKKNEALRRLEETEEHRRAEERAAEAEERAREAVEAGEDIQIDLLNYLHDAGHRCAVVRTPEFALALLEQWGAPVDLGTLERVL